VMGGEAPDPGSPGGEGNKRSRTTTSTTTSTSPGDSGCPPRPLITARHASRTAVVSSPELLEHVLSFLAGRKVEAREDLGRAALACRSWRDVAVGEEVWGRVASEVMPAMRGRVSEVGARRCMMERGLCHRDRRALVALRWKWDFRLQVEVWDRLDGLRLLSAEGEVDLWDHPHVLLFTGAARVEVVCPAFSAASRDPVQRRFASIGDYFRRGPGTVEDGICLRVYVRDERTGRQALLWDVGHEEEFRCEDVPAEDPMRPHLPEGSLLVREEGYMPIRSPALPGQDLHAYVGFYICPEAGQEGVAEVDKIWRGAGAGGRQGQLRRPRLVLLPAVR
jgi:hypothetical protein